MRKDYYATLGVPEGASQDEIKRAYRKLARKYHPDVNPGDASAEERFKEISEAYHVLGDAERRKRYDSVGPEAFAQEFDPSDFAQQFAHLFRGGGGGVQGGGFGLFEDLLGGGGFAAPGQAKGRDVRIEVQLGLEEILAGGERVVSYQRPDGGTAQARVRIPAGTRAGSRIRISGKGEPGQRGGPAGDLYLEVRVRPHARFQLDGDDLRVGLEVTLYDAALGATVEVPTPGGTTKIKLPARSRNGQVMKVRGRGAPKKGGGYGDLLATIRLRMPKRMDEELTELFREMRERHPYDPTDS